MGWFKKNIGAIVGTVVAGPIGLSIGASHDAKVAQQDAANKALEAQSRGVQSQLDLQNKMYENSRADIKPYQEAGVKSLADLQKYDINAATGEPAPSYDKEYTQNLGNYNEDPAVAAQKALGQQSLQRQLNARGLNYGATGASAGAELNQKFDVQGYDKYKNQLADRYTALKGEYTQRRANASTGYDQLMNMVKVGQGAAGTSVSANQNMSTQGSKAYGDLANAQAANATAQGKADASWSSGLAALPGQAAQTYMAFQGLGGANMFGGGAGSTYNASKPDGEFT